MRVFNKAKKRKYKAVVISSDRSSRINEPLLLMRRTELRPDLHLTYAFVIRPSILRSLPVQVILFL